jgi:hypothetical protein
MDEICINGPVMKINSGGECETPWALMGYKITSKELATFMRNI